MRFRFKPALASTSCWGGAGNDHIWVVEGSRCSNTIDGGTGNDVLVGGDTADLIFGGKGNDYIRISGQDVTSGRDTVYGGAGDDTIRSAPGDALIFGGSGNDRIYVFRDVTVYGANGNDTFLLSGAGGPAMLSGGAGDDTFDGSVGGNVTLDGGTGYDTLHMKNNFYSDADITGIERFRIDHVWTGTVYAPADCWTSIGDGAGTIIESSKPGSRETLEGGAGHDTLVGRLDADGAVTFMVAAETAADVDTIQGFDRSAGDQLALHGIAALGVVDRLSTDTTAVAPDNLVYQTDTGDLLFNGQLLAHIQAAGANFGGALQWSDFILS